MRRVETMIVGGGIAGLACGRRLAEAQRDFLLVSDRLGGRMHVAADGNPLGAAYVTSDYRHVLRFVERRDRIRLSDVYFCDERRYATVYTARNAARAGALARLYRLVVRLRGRLDRLRHEAPWRCQRELMRADPVLREAVETPAVDLVRDHGLEEVTDVYCAPMFASTLFVPWDECNAFYFLANLFPIWLDLWAADLTRTVARLTAGWESRIERHKVLGVEEEPGGGYRAHLDGAEVVAERLVVAVPDRNAREMAPALVAATDHAVRDVPYCTVHVRGARRREYDVGKIVFFRAEHPVRVLWRQPNGVDVAFAPTASPDLSPYYTSWTVVEAVAWKTAVQLTGASWRPLQPRPDLFTVGDHNVCGLEDSYLTGLFAANRIVAGRAGPRA